MVTTTGRSPSRTRRRAAAAALVAALVDLAVLLALHVLVPDVDPVRSPTSDYVHGSAVAYAAPVAAGLGALALAVACWPLATGRRRPGPALLLVFAAAKLVQALFPIDPEGAVTTSGTVHDVTGNVAFLTLPIAALVLARPVERGTGRAAPVALAWLVLVTTVAVVAGDALGVFGLTQRLYLATAAGWVAVTALAILAPARGIADPQPAVPGT